MSLKETSLKISEQLLKAELAKRAEAAKKATLAPKFELDKYFFPKQKDFFRGTKARFKVAVCSRRAGKTVGIVGDAFDLCLSEAKVRVLYITLTRENCLEIIWPDVLELIEKYKIDCKVNHQRLTVTFANGSYFSCAGAKDKKEIGKFRGRKLRRIYIDEAQNFPAYVQEMIEADLMPTLRDLKGEMVVTGTPGPLKRGFFYNIATNGLWESHNWTAFQNPHLHDPENGKDYESTLEEERRVRGIDKNDATYVRESYGIWTEDFDSLVFRFDPKKNIDVPPIKDMTYVFGIDIGYNDADAIAVLGYDNKSKNVYLVDEYVKAGNDITALVEQIERMRIVYEPVKMVLDAGALGKKIQEEIIRRHSIPVAAADKHRKLEYIALMNDDLRTGKFKAKSGTRFEEDSYLVQWDKDAEDPSKLVISKNFHSDITDAVLYAWRECYHYFYTPPVPATARNTDQYMAELEAREAEAMERAKDAANEELESDVQSWDDLGIDSDDF